MAIRKLSEGRYQADVQVAGKRVRENFATEVEAKQREAQLLLDRDARAPAAVDRTLTLGDLKERVYALVWSKQKAGVKSEHVARLVVQYFGAGKRVHEIDARGVNDFKLALTKSGNTGSTINRKLAALSKMLRVAHDEGSIVSRPALKREKEGKGRDRYLTHEEEDRLVATLKVWGKHDEVALIMFLLDTGCRLGEALSLRWSDVGTQRVTFLDTKNGETRAIPLTRRLRDMLRDRVQGEATVFPGHSRGMQKTWGRVRRHLGFKDDPHFVIHILRHTCASRLLQGGADLEYVRRWLGHRDIKMTQRYAHLAPTSLDALTRILERKPEPAPRADSLRRLLPGEDLGPLATSTTSIPCALSISPSCSSVGYTGAGSPMDRSHCLVARHS